ncbi:MAG: xanthine dehydrogenase family protein [Deltaproteobacteria bacterium]|nr:xanthine dehydrogenase family protein [Deltaproteobacteria bacterium]
MRNWCGEPVPRVDGLDKARGRTVYLGDQSLDGALFGVLVRSPVAKGRLKKIYWDESIDWSGLFRVEAEDIPGQNCVSIIKKDMPCLAFDKIMYLGEPVALVASADLGLARSAALTAKQDIEPEKPLLDIRQAVEKYRQEPQSDGLIHSIDIERGDVQNALASSDLIVDGEYWTGPQEHVYLEPQVVAAIPRGDKIEILGSMQCPYYVRPAVALALGMPDENIIVRQTPTGGAFGGKEDFPSSIAIHAALLAQKAHAPVKIIFDRQEDISFTTKRHPSCVKLKAGVKADGTFSALEAEVLLDGGAYTTLSPVVLSRAAIHACGPYRWRDVGVKARTLRTNMPPYGAFRGFGAPQVHFAIESHVDEIAARLDMDPVELRKKNLLREGDQTATGQVLKESVSAVACLESVSRAADYAAFKKKLEHVQSTRHKKYGLGVASFWHGGGFTGAGEEHIAAEVAIDLMEGGRVQVAISSTEMGQGERTTIPQIAAQALGGIPLDLVSCDLPDTSNAPDSGPTVASRTIMMVGALVESCCMDVLAYLKKVSKTRDDEQIADWPDAVGRALKGRPKIRFAKKYEKPPDLKWNEERHVGDAYAAYAWGAVAARVSIDMLTMETTVDDIWCTVDAGKAINPKIVEGQVQGGLVQALGYALFENLQVSEQGAFLQNRLQNYIVPTSMDTPGLHVELIENMYSRGPFGAKGVGELPMNGLAPAIRNALRQALGQAPNRIPMIPENLVEQGLAGNTGG